jgi:hypothetical protein
MRSRVFRLFGIAAVSFSLAALTLQAHAAGGTLVSTLFGSSTLFSDNSGEFLIKHSGSVNPTKVEKGDILVTVLGINTINGGSGDVQIGGPTNFNEVTAISAGKIASDPSLILPQVNQGGGVNIDLGIYNSVPLSAADKPLFDWSTGQILGGALHFTTAFGVQNDDTQIALAFEDSANDYTRSKLLQDGLSTATDGDPRLALGLSAAHQDILTVIAPVSIASSVGLQASITHQAWPGLHFAPTVSGGNGGFASPESMTVAQNGGFPIFDNLDFTLTTAPIPEPNTFIYIGTGLIGLAGILRYRRKA